VCYVRASGSAISSFQIDCSQLLYGTGIQTSCTSSSQAVTFCCSVSGAIIVVCLYIVRRATAILAGLGFFPELQSWPTRYSCRCTPGYRRSMLTLLLQGCYWLHFPNRYNPFIVSSPPPHLLSLTPFFLLLSLPSLIPVFHPIPSLPFTCPPPSFWDHMGRALEQGYWNHMGVRLWEWCGNNETIVRILSTGHRQVGVGWLPTRLSAAIWPGLRPWGDWCTTSR